MDERTIATLGSLQGSTYPHENVVAAAALAVAHWLLWQVGGEERGTVASPSPAGGKWHVQCGVLRGLPGRVCLFKRRAQRLTMVCKLMPPQTPTQTHMHTHILTCIVEKGGPLHLEKFHLRQQGLTHDLQIGGRIHGEAAELPRDGGGDGARVDVGRLQQGMKKCMGEVKCLAWGVGRGHRCSVHRDCRRALGKNIMKCCCARISMLELSSSIFSPPSHVATRSNPTHLKDVQLAPSAEAGLALSPPLPVTGSPTPSQLLADAADLSRGGAWLELHDVGGGSSLA
jgi:hypothetical protein